MANKIIGTLLILAGLGLLGVAGIYIYAGISFITRGIA